MTVSDVLLVTRKPVKSEGAYDWGARMGHKKHMLAARINRISLSYINDNDFFFKRCNAYVYLFRFFFQRRAHIARRRVSYFFHHFLSVSI